MRVMKLSMIALAVAGASQFAMASSQDESKGFLEDQSLTAKTRMLYMNRDFKKGTGNAVRANGNNTTSQTNKISGYRQDTGVSELVTYKSGFTQGTIGVGVDAYAGGSYKLDGGAGRAGNGLFATNGEGEPETTQSRAGGAIKFRLSDTTLKYGKQIVASPVFSTDDGRLLPEFATGTYISSDEIKGLNLNAGRFTALDAQTGMGHDSIGGKGQPGLKSINFAGATYQFTDNFVAGVAASDLEDLYKKQYINLNYTLPITEGQSLNFDFNGYRTKADRSVDKDLYNNKIWSLAAAYSIGAHKFTIAHQRNSGDAGYTYGTDGGATMYTSNSVQISDYEKKDERSWQARYDINMAEFGVPGLSFMTRYVKGDNIDLGPGQSEGKEHELNYEAKYVLQEGPAKDLSFRLRSAVYRADSDVSINSNNDVRVIVEYPLSIL